MLAALTAADAAMLAAGEGFDQRCHHGPSAGPADDVRAHDE
jgi:hypothetical protein